MTPQTLILIGLGVLAIFAYSKVAANKTAAGQSPLLSVPQGGLAQTILSALGVGTTAVTATVGTPSTGGGTYNTATINPVTANFLQANTPGGVATAGGGTVLQTQQDAVSQLITDATGNLDDNVGMIPSTAQLDLSDTSIEQPG